MSLKAQLISALQEFNGLEEQERVNNLIKLLKRSAIGDSTEDYWYVFWLGPLLLHEIPEIKKNPQNAELKKVLNECVDYLNDCLVKTLRAGP